MRRVFQAGGALPSDHPAYTVRHTDHDAHRTISNGEYLHIIAPRQVGKTSLLKRLMIDLDKIGWRCAYIDLATLMGFAKPDWYAELGKELARNLTPSEVPSLSNQLDLRRYLFHQALPWPNATPHIVLLLDEVEGVNKARDKNGQPFSDTFFMVLRNLYNQRDDYEGTLVVALAGAVNPGDLVQDPDISPFNVGQEINPDDFTSAETQALTQNLTKLDLPIDSAVHESIYNWTNGHPYLTQRICAELEKEARGGSLTKITPEVVTAVVETILNPANPLQQDSNLRHVGKMLGRLTGQAAQLWSRLRAGEVVTRQEAVGDLYLELYLTGAVKAEGERLVIRSRMYQAAFAAEKSSKRKTPTVDPVPRSITMSKSFRIFISSTWVDLQPEREAVEKALHRMKSTTFAGMEYFGSRPETPREVSLAEVDRSDVYIGIFAHRYGSGITEAEYRRARERGLPCFIYIKDDNAPVIPAHIDREAERVTRLDGLRRELKQNHTVSFFNSPDHLATQVVTDLHNLLGSAPSAREEESEQRGSKYEVSITGGQGIVIGEHMQVTQQFNKPEIAPAQAGHTDRLRLQHLADNIHQDMMLLKDYEDALRYEDDPRRRARYRREIEKLQESAAHYKEEYDALRAQTSSSETSRAMQAVSDQLQQMDAKLDALLTGQISTHRQLKSLRESILVRLDKNEQSIIANIVKHLDQTQLATTETVLGALESDRVTESTLQELLVNLQRVLTELTQQHDTWATPQLRDDINRIADVVKEPSLDVKHKLKIAIPLIPFLLSYEGELELNSGMNLEAAWQRLLAKVRGVDE